MAGESESPPKGGTWEGVTPRQAAWLDIFSDTCHIGKSDRVAQVGSTTSWRWRQEKDTHFARAFAVAYQIAKDRLHDQAVRLAMRETEPSERMLTELLRAHAPDLFDRATRMQHSGNIETTAKVIILPSDPDKD